jgi:TP901 family phage tail tape measure protein
MAYNLGTAEGVITTSYNGKGVDAAQKDIDGLTKKTGAGRGAMNDIGNAAGVAGLAIAAGFGAAVNAAANFEQRMSAVQAVSGASQAEMDQLSQKALQLGKDTSFSATEAAQAIEELVKSGISVPDVMNGAADAVVALAAAGEVSLPEAAKIASNAMNQFGLSAQEMPKVADLIAGAANASAIDVGEFGMSLSQVGAVANLAGASFADTATAIALMGNAGIKGSDAGTSLKTMLSNLQPATEKQAALFKKLGIITEDGSNQFYDAQGNLKSFAEIAGILQTSLKGMTAAQKSAALETMFGSDAIRAAAIFTKEGAAGFNEMATAMGKVSAADVAKTRLDNFKGSLEQLKGSLETAGIVIGQVLLPALRSIVEAITGALNAFLNLSSASQQIILGIVGIVGAALLMAAAVIKITMTIMKVIEVLKILRLAMATTWLAALGPIGLIIIAIAAVIAIIVLLWNKSETFRGIILGIWAAIQTAVQAVVTFFTTVVVPAFQAAWNGIVAGLTAVKNFFSAVWNAIVAVVTTVVSVIANIITTYVNIWKAIITTVVNAILDLWRDFWNTFGGVIKAAVNLVKAILELAFRAYMYVVVTTLNGIKNFFVAIWNAIVANVRAKVNLIKSVITTVFNAIRSVVTSIWNAIRSFTISVWNAIYSAVNGPLARIRSIVSSVLNAIRSAVVSGWNAVKSATTSAWNSLVSIVGSKINAVLAKVRSVVGQIRGVFSGAAGWLVNAGRNIIQGLLNGIESMIGQVTSKLKSLTNLIPKVKGPEQRDKKLLRPAAKWIMGGFIDELDKGIIASLMKLSKVTDMIPDTITSKGIGEIIPATGLAQATSRVAQPVSPAGRAPVNIQLTTYNPVGKTTTEELNDQATRLATLGVLG